MLPVVLLALVLAATCDVLPTHHQGHHNAHNNFEDSAEDTKEKDHIEALFKLTKLRDLGLLSENEFQSRKDVLINAYLGYAII